MSATLRVKLACRNGLITALKLSPKTRLKAAPIKLLASLWAQRLLKPGAIWDWTTVTVSLSLLKWNNSSGYGVIWMIKPICISKLRKTHASLSVFEIWLTADEVFSGCHIGSSIWIRLHKCDFQQWFCMLLFQTPGWKVSKSRIILWQKLKSI